jgi:Tol biopolymer transport system component
LVKTDGTGYREVFRDETPADPNRAIGIPYYCCRLSWDNRYLPVTINSPTSGGRLLVVSVADGRRRELRRLETGQFVKAVFSPDGRFVAYETAPQPGQIDSFRVYVVPAQGGTPRLVYESAPKGRSYVYSERLSLMDWTADGRYLAIAAASFGKTGLYLYPIQNGTSAGKPLLIRNGDFRDGQSRPTGAFVYSDAKPVAT